MKVNDKYTYKLFKVIDSCETYEQYKIAEMYVNLYYKEKGFENKTKIEQKLKNKYSQITKNN